MRSPHHPSTTLFLSSALLLAGCAAPADDALNDTGTVAMPFEASLVLGGEGEDLTFPGGQTTMIYHGHAPDGGVSVVEVIVAPKTLGAPPHTHTEEDEYFYVIEGEITFLVGDGEHTAHAGSHGAMPRGLVHAFWNGSEEPARVLITIAPGTFGGFFEEVSAEIRAKNLTDREAIGKLLTERAALYGCTIHGESIGPLVEKHGLH